MYLEHVNLVVSDLDAMLKFYRAAFATKAKASGTASRGTGCILAMTITT